MRILFATDGSDYSEGAAKFLTNFRFTPDDEIIILHAINWVPFKDDRESHYASLKKIKQEIAPKILDSAVDILKSLNAKMSTALGEGYPDKAIIEAAVDSDADLIVMGARGLRGIKSLIIGSVTRAVAINSPKPVLIAKLPPVETNRGMKVLFATDGSEHSEATARLLALMPFPEKTEITVFHVIWSPLSDIPGRYVLEIDDKIKENVMKARSLEYEESESIIEQAKKHLGGRFTAIQGLTKVGDPSIEILSTAESLKADLIAVGSRGLRGLAGMLGSVSRNIVIHSTCSVLVGK